MPKKNFKQVADNNPALAFLGTQKPVQDKDAVQVVHISEKPTNNYCNINLRLRQDLKNYLNDVSWRKRTNMTQYLSNLIETDMKQKAKEGKSNV